MYGYIRGTVQEINSNYIINAYFQGKNSPVRGLKTNGIGERSCYFLGGCVVITWTFIVFSPFLKEQLCVARKCARRGAYYYNGIFCEISQ